MSLNTRIFATLAAISLAAAGCAPEIQTDAAQTSSSLTSGSCFADELGGSDFCEPMDVMVGYAQSVCQDGKSKLAHYTLGKKCKGGNVSAIQFQCCDAPVAPQDINDGPQLIDPILEIPTVESCMSDKFHSEDCLTTGQWKAMGNFFCGNMGGELSDVQLGDACKDGSQDAKLTCCKTANVDDGNLDDVIAKPKPHSPVDVEAPVSACISDKFESNDCLTPAQWKEMGFYFCGNIGANLTGVSFGDVCKDGYSSAKLDCCKFPVEDIMDLTGDIVKPKPDAPADIDESSDEPTASCLVDKFNSDDALSELEWNAMGKFYCGNIGGELTNVTLGEKAKDGFNAAKIECCKAAHIDDCAGDMSDDVNTKPFPKPQLPPIDLDQDEVNSCKTDVFQTTDCLTRAQWKEMGTYYCGNIGGELTMGSFTKECADGGFHVAKLQCCKSLPTTDDVVKPKPELADDVIFDIEISECVDQKVKAIDGCASADVLVALAQGSCAKLDRVLTQQSLDNKCGKGGHEGIKFQCCDALTPVTKPAPVKPLLITVDADVPAKKKPVLDYAEVPAKKKPAPAADAPQDLFETACFQKKYTGPATCRTMDEWLGEATYKCGVVNAQMSRFSLGKKCKNGGYTAIKFECCSTMEYTYNLQ